MGKLSEMILLGDSLRDRVNTCFLSTATVPPCGCAIGGATLAMGRVGNCDHQQLWPWLHESAGSEFHGASWEAIIGCNDEIGFSAVMAGRITIEQLADFVKSVEPECGACNRFECTCEHPVDFGVTSEVAICRSGWNEIMQDAHE